MDSNNDRFYIGSDEFELNTDESKNKLVQRMRQYLGLRHVSFLLGNGASLPIGSAPISSVRKIQTELNQKTYALTSALDQKEANEILQILLPDKNNDLSVESLLGLLSHFESDLTTLPSACTIEVGGKAIKLAAVQALTRLLKKWLYIRCNNLTATVTSDQLSDHRELFRRLLLRSNSLPRAKVFTLNYDLFIEMALDELGVTYFDGFVGTIKRELRTESYHYDLYFPGDTTEGKVTRVDRVLQLYKMHGSLNWRRRSDGYRLDVVIDHKSPDEKDFGDVMVYPSPLKLAQMHGYPYSEMFRHFSSQIHQPQSVLFTLGYSFADEHVNRIIYQALTIPSFSLVIVCPSIPSPAKGAQLEPWHEIHRLISHVNSKRILVLAGGIQDPVTKSYLSGAGTFKGFANDWMPDLQEMAIEERVKGEAERAISRSSGEV